MDVLTFLWYNKVCINKMHKTWIHTLCSHYKVNSRVTKAMRILPESWRTVICFFLIIIFPKGNYYPNFYGECFFPFFFNICVIDYAYFGLRIKDGMTLK